MLARVVLSLFGNDFVGSLLGVSFVPVSPFLVFEEIKSQPSFPGWILPSAQHVGVADWFAAGGLPSPVYFPKIFSSAPSSWGERAASICKFVW